MKGGKKSRESGKYRREAEILMCVCVCGLSACAEDQSQGSTHQATIGSYNMAGVGIFGLVLSVSECSDWVSLLSETFSRKVLER